MSNGTLGDRTQSNDAQLFHSVWESLYTIHGVAGLPRILSACFWVVSSMSHFNHVRLSVKSFHQRVRAVPYILLLNQWLKERGIKCIGIFCVMAERTREDVTEQVLARQVGGWVLAKRHVSETVYSQSTYGYAKYFFFTQVS